MVLLIATAGMSYVQALTFHPGAGAAFGVAGAKPLPDMPQPSTRYLNPDQRDFLAVTLRSPADPGAALGGLRPPS